MVVVFETRKTMMTDSDQERRAGRAWSKLDLISHELRAAQAQESPHEMEGCRQSEAGYALLSVDEESS